MKKTAWIKRELKKIEINNLEFDLEESYFTDNHCEPDDDTETSTIRLNKMRGMMCDRVLKRLLRRPTDPKHSFRHEVGHVFLFSIYDDVTDLKMFKKIFGDVEDDYPEYNLGIIKARFMREDDDYVSTYAQIHPEEDFAETFAEYMETGGLVYDTDSKEVEKKKLYIEYLIEKYA